MLYRYTTRADGVKFHSASYCYSLTLMNSIFFSEQKEGILKDNACFETDLCSDLIWTTCKCHLLGDDAIVLCVPPGA